MAVWYYRSLATGTGAGTSWTNARTTLGTMTSVVAGEQIWVADDHNEALGANLTVTFPGTATNPNIVICADRTKASPATGDWKTTGVVSTTGTFSITIGGSAYIYGLTFTSGLTSAAVNGMAVGQGSGSWQYFDTCVLRLATSSTSGSSRISLGQTGNNVGNRVTLDNTQMNLSVVQQNITPNQGHFVWRNTANPFPNAVPTNFVNFYNQPFTWTFEAVDFLVMDSGKTLIVSGLTWYRVAFYGCRIGGNGTFTTAITSPGSEVIICHSGVPTNPAFVSRMSRYAWEGSDVMDQFVCRVGGSDDSVRPISRQYMNNSGATATSQIRPLIGLPFVVWNNDVNTNKTITIYGILAATALPTNFYLWFEVQYFGDSTPSPLMTVDHCAVKPNLHATPTNWTADTTSDWTASALVTARANSQSYGIGTFIKVASNPGRLFVCATAGTTASTEPGTYATATDGGAYVVDGGAWFRPMMRFKMSMTLSSPQPKLAGPIYIYPRVHGYTSATLPVYLDAEIS